MNPKDTILWLSKLTDDEIIDKLHGVGINSKTRLQNMLNLTAFADGETFWRVFHETWSGCDDTWDLQDDLMEAIELHLETSPIDFLDQEAREFYSSLPDRITIYRGCSRSRIHAVSWTTDLEVAKGFAKGHRGISVPDAVLMTAKIRKSDIITVIQDRDESEIIIDPCSLRYLRELKMDVKQAA